MDNGRYNGNYYLGFRVCGFRAGVQGLRFRISGLGLRV